MDTDTGKAELLSQLERLDQEINDYFDLTLDRARTRYKRVGRGNKVKVVDKVQERKIAVQKWRDSVKTDYETTILRFRRAWDLLQNNPELDLCAVTDNLGNSRIFQVHKLGAALENVSLTTLEILTLKQHDAEFLQVLASMGTSKEGYESFLEWQTNMLGRNATLCEQLPKVYWNSHKYQWSKNSYRICASVKSLSSYATYCKFFSKLGMCTNANCKFVHDPRNVTACKDFLASGNCKYGSKCRLAHTIGNEYVTPYCKAFVQHACNFERGAEQWTQSREQESAICCRYIHSSAVDPSYPVCRQFAHMGFCYRGLHCKFPHYLECPDSNYSSNCFLNHCKYPHIVHKNLPDKDAVALVDIPPSCLLIPPAREKDHKLPSSSWYGLRTKQQSINVKDGSGEKFTAETVPALQLEPTSSTEDVSTSEVSSTESSDISSDELDADFIKL
ncbi:LAQU0S01e13608g1_1 [Lachancea quebecensis]|uniref:LAQU0S01e13608g1_1 n=1 Tax=Lachancea quebecensis TaxID=1654605 RepID=A0A0P1KLW2_9SACH|nr:LAQU0S01e13608g1_1 [Lachancea quebecensis]